MTELAVAGGVAHRVADLYAELVVTTGAKTWRIDMPGGPLPTLVKQPVTISPSAALGVVVLQQGIGYDVWSVFGWKNGELVVLELPRWPDLFNEEQQPGGPSGVPYLGGGFDGEGGPDRWNNESWIQDGWMYTSSKIVGTESRDVFRWDRSGDALTPTLLGRYCFDQDDIGRDR